MRKQWLTVWILSKSFTLRYLRDKTALFFTFVFPLAFLIIFGFIFRGGGATFNIALINESKTVYSQNFTDQLRESKSLKFADVSTLDEAKTKLTRQEIDLILILPQEFGQPNSQGVPTGSLQLKYATQDEQTIQTYENVFSGIVQTLNTSLVPTQPPITLQSENLNLKVVSRFDYLFAGILGYALMSLGVFSMSSSFPADKQSGALRRLRMAPLKVWQLILSIGFSRIVVGVIIAALMYGIASLMFEFTIQGNLWYALIFTVFSTVCMFGIGMGIGGWAKNENQASPIAQLITLPMMFLSGTFFPRFVMPEALQQVSMYLPLSPVIDGLRKILTEGASLTGVGFELILITGWIVIIYVIAIKTFRWE